MNDLHDSRNLTMLTDFYELTMANGYFKNEFKDTIAYFDMFFRTIPDGGGYVIMAGVEQLVDYFRNLSFSKEDIDYLRGKASARISSTTLQTSDSPAMCGPCPRHPDIPRRADSQGQRPRNPGTVCRNDGAADDKSSEPHRHQGKQSCQGGTGQSGNGIRLKARSGLRRSDLRRKGSLYRRLCRHRVHDIRRDVRHSCARHHGSQLGAAL